MDNLCGLLRPHGSQQALSAKLKRERICIDNYEHVLWEILIVYAIARISRMNISLKLIIDIMHMLC